MDLTSANSMKHYNCNRPKARFKPTSSEKSGCMWDTIGTKLPIPTNLLTNLPTYLTTYLLAYLPTCLPTYLPSYLRIYLLTYLPTWLLTYVSTYLPNVFARTLLWLRNPWESFTEFLSMGDANEIFWQEASKKRKETEEAIFTLQEWETESGLFKFSYFEPSAMFKHSSSFVKPFLRLKRASQNVSHSRWPRW